MFSNKKYLYYYSLLFFFAFVLRIAWFFIIASIDPRGFLLHDSKGYFQLAENIVNFKTFSKGIFPDFSPEVYRTPVYPAFLGLFLIIGKGIPWIIITQIILSSINCIIVFDVACRLLNSLKAAWIAGLILALDIATISLSNFILSETLFTFLLLCSIRFLLMCVSDRDYSKNIFISALFLGLAILCRPGAAYLPVVLLPCFFILKKLKPIQSFSCAAAFLLGVCIVVAPWMARNKLMFDKFTISTTQSVILIYYHAAEIYSGKNNVSLGEAQLILAQDVQREIEKNKDMNPVEISKYEQKYAIGMIQNNPLLFLKNYTKGIIYFFLKPVRAYLDWQTGKREFTDMEEKSFQSGKPMVKTFFEITGKPSIIMVLFQLIYLPLTFVVFIAGLIKLLYRKQYFLFFVLAATVFYFSLTTRGTTTEGRFRVPAAPLIALGCAIVFTRHAGKDKSSEILF